MMVGLPGGIAMSEDGTMRGNVKVGHPCLGGKWNG